MSMIDDIKRDLKNGTLGEWGGAHFSDDSHSCNCRYILGEYGGMGSIATIDVCKEMEQPWGDDEGPDWPQAQANARRIMRVPDMEAALITAERLAEVMEADLKELKSFFSDGDIGDLAEDKVSALAAYRAATGAA